MKVRELMTKEVIALSPEDEVNRAIELFAKHHISGCPVIEDSAVVGILSETDIMKALKAVMQPMRLVYPSLSLVSVAFVEEETGKEVMAALKSVASSKVSALMRKNVITIDPESTIEDAIKLMSRADINRIPVVKDGVLVGIITRFDVIKGLGGGVGKGLR
ncbi:MAG: CBS domain-containing protein [Candidatus Thermoplasmatota archaeon]